MVPVSDLARCRRLQVEVEELDRRSELQDQRRVEPSAQVEVSRWVSLLANRVPAVERCTAKGGHRLDLEQQEGVRCYCQHSVGCQDVV